MLSEILIYRDFPVINGFVQVPPNFEQDKSRVSLDRALGTLPGSGEQNLSLGSGPNTGSKFGAQQFLRLQPLQPGESYLSKYGKDPQVELSYPR